MSVFIFIYVVKVMHQYWLLAAEKAYKTKIVMKPGLLMCLNRAFLSKYGFIWKQFSIVTI